MTGREEGFKDARARENKSQNENERGRGLTRRARLVARHLADLACLAAGFRALVRGLQLGPGGHDDVSRVRTGDEGGRLEWIRGWRNGRRGDGLVMLVMMLVMVMLLVLLLWRRWRRRRVVEAECIEMRRRGRVTGARGRGAPVVVRVAQDVLQGHDGAPGGGDGLGVGTGRRRRRRAGVAGGEGVGGAMAVEVSVDAGVGAGVVVVAAVVGM